MAEQSAQERTERATPRKLQEAKRLGQVAKSADLNSAFILIFMAFFLWATQEIYLNNLSRFFTGYFAQHITFTGETADLLIIFRDVLLKGFSLFLPILVLPVIVALGTNLMQIGFLFAPSVLLPKGERLNPFNGLQRMFSLRGLFELVKTILKIVIVGVVMYLLIKNQLPALAKIFYANAAEAVVATVNFGISVLLYGSAAYLILALVDYFYQRYEYMKSMRMTRQELKEELRQTEGDPLIKAQIRRRMRQVALNQIRQEVPRATVVITNPVSLAVALLYQEQEMEAPKVTAKGVGVLASQIKKIARENDVQVVENKELARFLYYKVEINEKIPVVLYQVVAEILAHVYRLKGKVAG